jgi:hypothetical protein
MGNTLALGRDGADCAAQFVRDLLVCFASGEAPQKLLIARSCIGSIHEAIPFTEATLLSFLFEDYRQGLKLICQRRPTA